MDKRLAVGLIALSASLPFTALAQSVAEDQPLPPQPQARQGDHPAVVVARMWPKRSYDYESKFYPHPAWLALAPEAPHEMGDHPAVLVAKAFAKESSSVAATATQSAAEALHANAGTVTAK